MKASIRCGWIAAALLALPHAALAVTLKPGDFLVADPDFIHVPLHRSAIWHVDGQTGDRTILSDPEHGAGPAINAATDVLVDSSGNILVADGYGGAILGINPQSGDRRWVSAPGYGIGSGPPFMGFGDMVQHSDGMIYMANYRTPQIIRFDPVTGDRAIVSDGERGSGPPLMLPTSVAFDQEGRLLVADAGPDDPDNNGEIGGQVLSIDLATGDRGVVWSSSDSLNPLSPSGVAVNRHGDIVIISHCALWTLDLESQSSELFATLAYSDEGAGCPGKLSYDPHGDRFLVTAREQGVLLAIGAEDRRVTLISGDGRGLGEPFRFPHAVAVVVPEPTTAELVILAVAVYGLSRRLRARR